jgi:uncharacterized protein YbdZ (MbtH family)
MVSHKLVGMDEREDKTIYKVVVNREEQYSIMPIFAVRPNETVIGKKSDSSMLRIGVQPVFN